MMTAPVDPGTIAWPSVRGKVARFTRLDSCGRPVVGAHSVLVTDGFTEITASPQFAEGNEITVTKANGRVCINDKADDTLNRYDISITCCAVNPALKGLTCGYEQVLDYAGRAVGFRVGEDVNAEGVAVEVWSDVVPEEECAEGAVGQWGYFLIPRIVSMRTSSDFQFQNDALSVQLAGRTKRPAWGTGPYNVVGTGTNGTTPGKLLTPLGKKQHLHAQLTTIAPPDPEDYPEGTFALTA